MSMAWCAHHPNACHRHVPLLHGSRADLLRLSDEQSDEMLAVQSDKSLDVQWALTLARALGAMLEVMSGLMSDELSGAKSGSPADLVLAVALVAPSALKWNSQLVETWAWAWAKALDSASKTRLDHPLDAAWVLPSGPGLV